MATQWTVTTQYIQPRRLGCRVEFVGFEFLLALVVNVKKLAARFVFCGVSIHVGLIPPKAMVTHGEM